MLGKLILLLVLLIIGVVGAGAFMFFTGSAKPPELRSVTLYWGEITDSTTEIKADIRVDSQLPVNVGAASGRLEVPVDFYDVTALTLSVPGLRLERGESTLTAQGVFRQGVLPQWWPHFVNNGETLKVTVRPSVSLEVMGRTVETDLPSIDTTTSIPLLSNIGSDEPQTLGFDTSSPIDLVRDPAGHFVVGPPRPDFPVLTVESWELHWGAATEESTEVLGTTILKNETLLPLPVQGLQLALTMNDIEVLPMAEVTPEHPVLPPGESVPLRLQAHADNARLVEWWTSHLQNDELTLVNTRIGLTVVLPLAGLPGVSQNIRLPMLPVPAFRCDVQTDILGAANYEIARALGTASGPQPTPASIECQPPDRPTLTNTSQ